MLHNDKSFVRYIGCHQFHFPEIKITFHKQTQQVLVNVHDTKKLNSLQWIGFSLQRCNWLLLLTDVHLLRIKHFLITTYFISSVLFMNIVMHYYIFNKVTRKNKVDFLEGFFQGKRLLVLFLSLMIIGHFNVPVVWLLHYSSEGLKMLMAYQLGRDKGHFKH